MGSLQISTCLHHVPHNRLPGQRGCQHSHPGPQPGSLLFGCSRSKALLMACFTSLCTSLMELQVSCGGLFSQCVLLCNWWAPVCQPHVQTKPFAQCCCCRSSVTVAACREAG
jgi:hypothetical protein